MYDFTFFVDVESTYFVVPKNLKSEGVKCKKLSKSASDAGLSGMPQKLKKKAKVQNSLLHKDTLGIISFIFSGHRMKIERSVHPHPEEIR